MAHIKHFIAFILATAAFPLVVTLPISGTLKLSRRDTHPDPQAAAPSFKFPTRLTTAGDDGEKWTQRRNLNRKNLTIKMKPEDLVPKPKETTPTRKPEDIAHQKFEERKKEKNGVIPGTPSFITSPGIGPLPNPQGLKVSPGPVDVPWAKYVLPALKPDGSPKISAFKGPWEAVKILSTKKGKAKATTVVL